MKTAREVAHEFGRLALAPMDINCSAETHDPDCDAVTDLIEQARAEGAAVERKRLLKICPCAAIASGEKP
jgi:hypothetical protein